MNKDDQVSTLSPLELEDSQEHHPPPRRVKTQRMPSDSEAEWEADQPFFSMAGFHTQLRKRSVDPRNFMMQQLLKDPNYARCLHSHRDLIDFLVYRGITDVYDYLKQCNKEGVLLETAVSKFLGRDEPLRPRYTYLQCMKIHQLNLDQRNISRLGQAAQELKHRKKDQKLLSKTHHRSAHFEVLQDPETDRQKEIERSLTRRHILANTFRVLDTRAYKVSPFTQPIDPDLVKSALYDYICQHRSIIEQFEVARSTEKQAQPDSDSDFLVDYDELSDDSLAPHFQPHPQLRDPIYRNTMQFQFIIYPLTLTRKTILTL